MPGAAVGGARKGRGGALGGRRGQGRRQTRARPRGAPTAAREGQTEHGERGANPRRRCAGQTERNEQGQTRAAASAGQTRTAEARANPNRGRGRPSRPFERQTFAGPRRPPSAPPRPLPVLFAVHSAYHRRNQWVYRFLFRARKRGGQFSVPLAPWGCVLSEEPTRTHSRALNQTALGSHPCVALSSVG